MYFPLAYNRGSNSVSVICSCCVCCVLCCFFKEIITLKQVLHGLTLLYTTPKTLIVSFIFIIEGRNKCLCMFRASFV